VHNLYIPVDFLDTREGSVLSMRSGELPTLIFRFLHSKQPCLDFLCPLLDLGNFASGSARIPSFRTGRWPVEYRGRITAGLPAVMLRLDAVDEVA
jgi:hypothetical protein